MPFVSFVSLDRLRYEVKLAWKPLVLMPLLLTAPITLLVIIEHFTRESPAHVLLGAIEMLLPIAGGVLVATTIAQDAMLELHLSFPRTYQRTGMLRLLMILIWIALLSWLAISGDALFGQLALPTFADTISPIVRFLLIQLIWLAPLMWLGSVGFCVALLVKSRSAGGALLGGVWLLDILFVGNIAGTTWLRPLLLFPTTLLIFPANLVSRSYFETYWLTTRFELLAMALVFFIIGRLLLQNTESLLKGATEE
jgi:hypothetical protein